MAATRERAKTIPVGVEFEPSGAGGEMRYFHLDILPERRYTPLVCLPESNANALNYCKERWTY